MACFRLLLFAIVFFGDVNNFPQVNNRMADKSRVGHVGFSELFVCNDALFIDATLVGIVGVIGVELLSTCFTQI